MRVIVTGGAGFIGSAVCRLLVGTLGIEVINVDKLTYAANLRSLDSIALDRNYKFVQADICDRSAMEVVFKTYEPTAVLHLAAESHVDRSITGAKAFIETNILGSYQLLEAARNYFEWLTPNLRARFRFVHVSTDEVYGSLGVEGRFSEISPYQPSSPYSASKAASDHLAHAWYKTYGLPVIVSNCSNNYGPYQFPEKLIPLTILNALEGKPIPVYGTGSNVRDWLFVDDHALALAVLLERGRPGDKYNFGGDSECTNLTVVESICDILDRIVQSGQPRRSLIAFVKDRPGHDMRYAIDASLAHNQLGWKPRESFDSGLERTIRWYLKHKEWWEPLRQSVYAGEAIDYKNPVVRDFAVEATNENFKNAQEGTKFKYRILIQCLAVFKKINENWNYVSDPKDEEYIAKASESVKLLAGDCDDHSILMAACIKSIGGIQDLCTPTVIYIPNS